MKHFQKNFFIKNWKAWEFNSQIFKFEYYERTELTTRCVPAWKNLFGKIGKHRARDTDPNFRDGKLTPTD